MSVRGISDVHFARGSARVHPSASMSAKCQKQKSSCAAPPGCRGHAKRSLMAASGSFRCAPPQRPRGLHRSRVGAASCGCRARCSCWLGRHFIDATWWFDFTLSSQASGSVGPGSHSERELVGWIVRVMAKVDCPQPQIAILTVRVSWIIQILRNNNVPRPDCDRAFP